MGKTAAIEIVEPTDAERGEAAGVSLGTGETEGCWRERTGLDVLRSIDPDALRVWSVKGPKHAGGGELMGVLLRTTNEVVLVEQRASGRFTFYRKATAAEIESSLD